MLLFEESAGGRGIGIVTVVVALGEVLAGGVAVEPEGAVVAAACGLMFCAKKARVAAAAATFRWSLTLSLLTAGSSPALTTISSTGNPTGILKKKMNR